MQCELTDAEVTVIVEALSVIPYFPSAAGARLMVAMEIGAICSSLGTGLWLARRMAQLYREWPGLRDLRAVYGAKYPCRDGLDSPTGTLAYPDGIPSERQIEAPTMLQLPPGVHSADPQLLGIVDEVADATRRKANRKPPISAAVTDADVAEMVERQRRNQERASESRTALGR